jgi:hypothetical protein
VLWRCWTDSLPFVMLSQLYAPGQGREEGIVALVARIEDGTGTGRVSVRCF